jgi:hypothetical protein
VNATENRRGATIAVVPRAMRLFGIPDRTVSYFSFEHRTAIIVTLTIVNFGFTFPVLDRMRAGAGDRMCRWNPAKYGYGDKSQQNKGFFHLNGFFRVWN